MHLLQGEIYTDQDAKCALVKKLKFNSFGGEFWIISGDYVHLLRLRNVHAWVFEMCVHLLGLQTLHLLGLQNLHLLGLRKAKCALSRTSKCVLYSEVNCTDFRTETSQTDQICTYGMVEMCAYMGSKTCT